MHNTRTQEELKVTSLNNACVGGSDIDNLLKFVLDLMESVLNKNDRQVVRVCA
jgi:Holliday junction resolvase RusA-like endonuclease